MHGAYLRGGQGCMAHTQAPSSGNDTGAGADAQPRGARVGPFRAPATGKLSNQRLQIIFNATATFVAAANRSASSAKGAIAWRCGSDSVPLAALRSLCVGRTRADGSGRSDNCCRSLLRMRSFPLYAPLGVDRHTEYFVLRRVGSCTAATAAPSCPCTQVCPAQLGALFAQKLCSGPVHLCSATGTQR